MNAVMPPLQFDIFEATDKRYANSVGLWDMTPWAVLYTDSDKRVENLFLTTIERSFSHNGHDYRLTLRPARLRDPGTRKEREEYPQEREQVVEIAIRQLAAMRQRLSIEKNEAVSMTFGLYELQQELARSGRAYKYEEIREAIQILHGTQIEIARSDIGVDEDGDGYTTVFSSTIFPSVVRRESDNSEKQSRNHYYVQFNKLIVDALRMLEFRQLSYETLMTLRSVSRWVYKRLCHEIFHGSKTDPRIQHLRATEIIRNCGMDYSRLRDAFDRVTRAIEELEKIGLIEKIVLDVEYEATRGRKRKADIVYEITLTQDFLNQATLAVKRFYAMHSDYRAIMGESPTRFTPASEGKRKVLRKRRTDRAEARLL